MTLPEPVLPVRASRAASVRSNVCSGFRRRTVSGVTVRTRLVFDGPDGFEAVRRTVKLPVAVYTCVGFCSVEIVPSPKSQVHRFGPPAEVSVNWTIELTAGLCDDTSNDAVGADRARTPARIDSERTAI